MFSATCTAPVNIAVVKYWGKRDEKLILPINSSLSATLDQDQLRAKTTVAVSKDFTEDRMWLNGQEQSMENSRLQNVLKEVRRRARKRKCPDSEDTSSDIANLLNWHIHICSENNFPTAAGLASSAAGLACLVFSLSKLFKVDGDISDIARQGSGSACRSVYGGFVAWDQGEKSDGSDSLARQIVPQDYWPQMRILILVVSDQKKHVGSTSGMQTSVETSALLKVRTSQVVSTRMEVMSQAITDRNFQKFAEETMKDSNQFHAICLDTYPPISYMTDTSRDVVRLVHAINAHYGNNKAAYTFDAGPNACLYLLEQDVPLVLGLILHYFPFSSNGDQFVRGVSVEPVVPPQDLLEAIPIHPNADAVKYIIHTKVGPGPRVLGEEESLLGHNGLPKSTG